MFIDQQPHRDHGDSARFDWNDPLLIPTAHHFGGLVGNPKHGWCVGPVDIGVEEADPQPLLGNRAGQVDRNCALAYATLATGHCNDLAHSRDGLALSRLPVTGLADSSLAGGLAEFNLDVVNAFEACQQLAGFLNNPVALPLSETRQI